MLIRLIYASQIAAGRGHEDILRILQASDLANRRRDVTGVLAFDGRRIVQILEGPGPVVDALFGRISVDNRHVGIVKLSRLNIERRMFPGWGMTARPIADVLALTI